MGIRGAKASGGFWNNVDGELKGITFTTIGPGKDAEPGEWMYAVPSVHIDGADGPTTQHLFMGGAERYSIDEDGASEITGADGGAFKYGPNTPFGRFLDTLLDANAELDVEAALPDVEGGEPLTFEAINGSRLRLKQEVDVEGTKKQGKRVVKKDGKTFEYDRTNTIVSALYSLGGGKPAKKQAGKPAAAAAKPAAKGKKVDTDLRDKADAAIVALCEKAVDKKNPQGTTPTSKLSVGLIKLLGGKAAGEVRAMVNDEAYLVDATERGAFVYDAEESMVQLAE